MYYATFAFFEIKNCLELLRNSILLVTCSLIEIHITFYNLQVSIDRYLKHALGKKIY